MKQKWILLGLLTLALVATGCSSEGGDKAQTAGAAPGEKSATTTGTRSTETKGKETTGSSIGKYGKVKKIIGNSVTIALAEIPKKTGRGVTAGAEKTSVTPTDSPKEGGMPPGGEPPSGAPGGGGGTSGSQGSSAVGGSRGTKGSFGLNTEALDLTGEVLELLIPVGVKITTAGNGGMKEIDFADILQGDTIALYYVEDTENIERVVISPSTTD